MEIDETNAFKDFVEDLKSNWESHWMRTSVLKLIETIHQVKIKKKQKKAKKV